eukprot:PhF_6_TR973/c1_g1_i2/m.1878
MKHQVNPRRHQPSTMGPSRGSSLAPSSVLLCVLSLSCFVSSRTRPRRKKRIWNMLVTKQCRRKRSLPRWMLWDRNLHQHRTHTISRHNHDSTNNHNLSPPHQQPNNGTTSQRRDHRLYLVIIMLPRTMLPRPILHTHSPVVPQHRQ